MPRVNSQYAERAALDDREIDEILADSFPASDAPPWTLGVLPRSALPADRSP